MDDESEGADAPGPTAEDDGGSDDDGRGMYDRGSVGGDGETDAVGTAAADGTTESGEDGHNGADSDGGSAAAAGFDGVRFDDGDDEPEQATGTFYVKYAQDTAVTLHEIDSEQIYTLIENPGLKRHEIVEASLVAQPPMEVSYLIDELESRRTIPVERSPESPTEQVRGVGSELDTGQAVAIEREGKGEIHVLSVEPDRTERTAEEIPDDEMTYKNAARYGVGRVEVRSDAEAGIVSVRYLP